MAWDAIIDYLRQPPPAGRLRVIWFQNQPDHYFVNMLDALNALGGVEYVGIFFSPPPVGNVLTRLPTHSPHLFIGAGSVQETVGWAQRTMRPDAQQIIAAARFDMAIVGGYDYPIKRWIIRDCQRVGRPVALFADSNIRAEFDGSLKKAARRLVKRLVLPKIARQLGKILCANSAGVEYWKYYGVRDGRAITCTYYSDVPATSVPDADTRARLLGRCKIKTGDARRLLFTGARLVPAKGLDLMIEAFGRLELSARGWIWVVAGTGPLEAELRQKAGALDGNGIHFVGVQPHDVAKGLAGQAEAFVLPSVYEPHGIVVSEAMGAGTPVIASDAAGAAIDLVEPGKTGWLFKNRSAEDLTRVLKEATDNPERLSAMRPMCRAKFEQWYGAYSPLVQVPKVVAELLAGGRQMPRVPR